MAPSSPAPAAASSAAAAAAGAGPQGRDEGRAPSNPSYVWGNGKLGIFRANNTSSEVVWVAEKVLHNMEPENPIYWGPNNNKKWHLQVKWWTLHGGIRSGELKPYTVPEKLAKLFEKGRQPDDPDYSKFSGDPTQLVQYLDWDAGWGDSFLLGNLARSKRGTKGGFTGASVKEIDALPGGIKALMDDALIRHKALQEEEKEKDKAARGKKRVGRTKRAGPKNKKRRQPAAPSAAAAAAADPDGAASGSDSDPTVGLRERLRAARQAAAEVPVGNGSNSAVPAPSESSPAAAPTAAQQIALFRPHDAALALATLVPVGTGRRSELGPLAPRRLESRAEVIEDPGGALDGVVLIRGPPIPNCGDQRGDSDGGIESDSESEEGGLAGLVPPTLFVAGTGMIDRRSGPRPSGVGGIIALEDGNVD